MRKKKSLVVCLSGPHIFRPPSSSSSLHSVSLSSLPLSLLFSLSFRFVCLFLFNSGRSFHLNFRAAKHIVERMDKKVKQLFSKNTLAPFLPWPVVVLGCSGAKRAFQIALSLLVLSAVVILHNNGKLHEHESSMVPSPPPFD